jgi:hypothetical protein
MALLGAAALPAAARANQADFAAARDQAFTQADADGNGVLSPDEFAAFHDAMRKAFEAKYFAKVDTNHDGVISHDELAAAPMPHRHCGGAPPSDAPPAD